MNHRFNPKHVEKLDNPERRKTLPPDDILKMLDVQNDHTVADIGCGPGYFTVPLARLSAAVYGVDVSSDMLGLLQQKAADQGIDNIFFSESHAEHISLSDNSVDRLICSLVLHEVDDLRQTLSEFQRIIRVGGRILLIEWEKQETATMGPPVGIRIDSEVLLAEVEAIGLRGEISHPNSDQYIIVAE